MKNPAHFHRAEELNLLFDANPSAAVERAIDLINEHQLDHTRFERRLKIPPHRMKALLARTESLVDPQEIERFVTLVIEILAEHGIPTEAEF